MLDNRPNHPYNKKAVSGCGEVWYRAWFGTKRPRVRIPTLRPRRSKLCIACSDFFSKVRARSLRCSSFSNRKRCAGLRFDETGASAWAHLFCQHKPWTSPFGLALFSSIPASKKEASRCPARLLSVFRPFFCAQNGRLVRPQGLPLPGRPSRGRSRTAAARRRPHPARRQAGAKRTAHPAARAADRTPRR